ncbi:MAG: DUF302 domain-containing protein [Anaerolineales bacterium]|nr:DUF302 domain-containing protein [Anaerolineales bacterium]MCL4260926.1 DUF302 domain-containing protein [Anaerolineales bacterium]
MTEYYLSKTLALPYEEAIARVTDELQKEGFGVLTEIDVAATLKKKLNVDFRRYRILGACNPQFAHKALTAEAHIGVYLPCNVIVQDVGNGKIDVAAVDPLIAMSRVGNPNLSAIAEEVQAKLRRVIAAL